MTTPKVTVLTSVLNGEEFLAEAIDSILAQSFADFEFIIVDNASTDRTPDIIQSYDDPRVIHLRNPETLNLSQSLNKGLAAARGEYVARLDADDFAMPDRLDQQISFLDNNPHVALVASAWTDFGHGYAFPGVLSPIPPQSHSELITALAADNILAHSTITFRRKPVLDLGGYPEDYAYCMDYVLYLRLAETHQLAALGEATVAMRNHDKQITVDPSWQLPRAVELARATIEFAALPNQAISTTRAARTQQAKSCFRAALLALRVGRIGPALGWIWLGLASGPRALVSITLAFAKRLLTGSGQPRHLPGQGPMPHS
tara:strand:+ start:589 stop:1536 length:948 start_codon:yes stop_codon:yes gene_type:complete